jgi:hypothetical protein
VSRVTEKIKTRSKPTPSENFNSHPLQGHQRVKVSTILHESHCICIVHMYILDVAQVSHPSITLTRFV